MRTENLHSFKFLTQRTLLRLTKFKFLFSRLDKNLTRFLSLTLSKQHRTIPSHGSLHRERHSELHQLQVPVTDMTTQQYHCSAFLTQRTLLSLTLLTFLTQSNVSAAVPSFCSLHRERYSELPQFKFLFSQCELRTIKFLFLTLSKFQNYTVQVPVHSEKSYQVSVP